MVNARKKILVALSGGVDSAVAAALLKKQGYDVIGVYFRFFGSTWKPSFQVKRIAKKLGIPLKIVDARKEFKKKIIDYFTHSYKKGITPNPCVVCNKEMKFRLMLDLIKKSKFDCVATGHYAQIKARPFIQGSTFPLLAVARNSSRSNLSGIPQGRTLCKAKDKSKDQSYFLYRLTQKDLSKIIFPLGDHEKSEVKKMAKKMKLPVSKDESQDICFLGGKPVSEFLKKMVKWKKGEIRDMKGNKLGNHNGLPFYTIGQRKGIEIGPPTSRQMREAIRASGPGPYFVVGKNSPKNELIVSNDPKKLLTKKFFVNKVNWVNQGNFGDGEKKYTCRMQVQIRYHAQKFSATIKKEKGGKYAVETQKPLRAVTPGAIGGILSKLGSFGRRRDNFKRKKLKGKAIRKN